MVRKICSNRRLFLLGVIKCSAVLCLTGRLYYLQVVKNKQYRMLSDSNRTKISLVSAIRGNILDRDGLQLAYNRKQYDLILEPVKGIDIGKSVERLINILNISQSEYDHMFNLIKNATETTIILEDLNWEMVKKVELNLVDLYGIFISVNYKRSYFAGKALSHVVGYARFNYSEKIYSYVGKTGVEYRYDNELKGQPGILQEEIDAKMHVVRSLSRIVSKPGQDIKVSISSRLQSFVYTVLGQNGSAVVMDVNNGSILSMNSYPSYDNNLFVQHIAKDDWDRLANDDNLPLFNRVLAFQTPPGSTFKIMSALAALESGVISEDTTFFCGGHIKVGDRIFHCWKRSGHGFISLNEAISKSCNVYFYHIAQRIDIDYLLYVAMQFGFGNLSGMGLQEEVKGVIPDKGWREKYVKRWYVGDTVNCVIGHGYVLVTPLQLAVMTARLATGRNVVPSILYSQEDVVFSKVNFKKKNLVSVQSGMYKAVNSPNGTANKVYSNVQRVAGKTGTAEANVIKKTIPLSGSHSLFVGYSSYDEPKYALAVVMERSVGGAASIVAKKIFDYIHVNSV